MKYVLLAIFVLFSAQTAQVSACVADDGQSTTHSQHGAMSDGSEHDEHAQNMDCCDPAPTTDGEGCDSLSHCGACPAGPVTISAGTSVSLFSSDSQEMLMASSAPLTRSSSPPFRPPIS